MNRFLTSLIFLISSLPDADKHLDFLNSVVQATHDSVKNIKSGMDNFHSSMVQLSQSGENGGDNSKTAPIPADNAAPGVKPDGEAGGGSVEQPAFSPDSGEAAAKNAAE